MFLENSKHETTSQLYQAFEHPCTKVLSGLLSAQTAQTLFDQIYTQKLH